MAITKPQVPDLQIPEPEPRGSAVLPTHPKDVRDWLDSLPLADPPAAADDIAGLLAAANRQTLPPEDRLTLLNLIESTAAHIAATLEQRYLGLPLPLSPASQETAARVRRLHHALATGYKVCIVDQTTSRLRRRLSSKPLASALYGAMAYLGAVLMDYYQTYLTHPGGVWFEINQLFLCADQSGLLETPLAPLAGRPVTDPTVRSLYLRLALLALASPYHLRQGEAAWAFAALTRWVPYVEISSGPAGQSEAGTLLLDLDSDGPVAHVSAPAAIGPHQRLIDTSGLLPVLRTEMIQAHEQNQPLRTESGARLSEDIYRRLYQAWSMVPQRVFSRSDRAHSCDVALGLSDIWWLLARNSAGAPTGASTSGLAIVPDERPRGRAEYVVEPRQEDVWSRAYQADSEPTARRADKPKRVHPPTTYLCTVLNESAGGLCLTCGKEAPLRARVGELVGIRDGENHTWEIGAIRWIKDDDRDQLEFGIQMIAPTARPVLLRTPDQPDVGDARGLLLPELRPVNRPASLIAPSPPFIGGQTALVKVAGQLQRMRLTRLLESTGLFAHFQFEPMNTPIGTAVG